MRQLACFSGFFYIEPTRVSQAECHVYDWHGADEKVMSNQAVEIKVYGRVFKVNCPSGQEDALRASAADFDQRLHDLSERTKISNLEQLLMFTGLNVCNELHNERHEQQRNEEKLTNRINEMEDLLEKALQYQPER